MTLDRPVGSLSTLTLALTLVSAWGGCSQSGPATSSMPPASGGLGGQSGSGTGGATNATNVGGSVGLGGVTTSGGQLGTETKTSGGSLNSGVGGGTNSVTGGATGVGANASGGTAGNGGSTGKGGATAGGADASGGTTSSGGASGKAGSSSVGNGGGGGSAGGTTTSAGGGTCAPPTVSLTGANAVANGPPITFNDDAGWCWYQDERAVVDVKGNKLVVGSVAFKGTRKGNMEAVIYDLETRKASSPAKLGNPNPDWVDDHNAPALMVRPDGKYAAMWAGHNHNCLSYFSVYDGTAWATEKTFDWTPHGCPWSRQVTYSNLWYLGSDLVSFVRSIETSPSYLVSTDNGGSWSYGGRLTATTTVGYVAGYFKYWGNNTDRVDFVGTEAHPRDFDNSLYSGYVKDGKVYTSAGKQIDDNVANKEAIDITAYTPVFKTRDKVGGLAISNTWNSDLVRYADGTLGLIWTGRVGSTDNKAATTDLRLLYGRFDGTSWKLTYLSKAGPKLYADEQDYTGLGALHPDDPTTIFISTPYDPRDESKAPASKREIWRGTTCDNGATFKWTPVTANSTKDNLRPIVPKWDAQHTALLWMQGEYISAQDMTMAVVGTITGP